MSNSRQIAGLVGPMLVAMTASESEWVQPHLYDHQIAPLVYLSGTLLLLAGLSIVRAHNRWRGGWPVLITLVGWFAVLGGLFRMFAAERYHQSAALNATPVLVLEAILLLVGIFLTFQAYRPAQP
jgi:FtsH-binding integral membrane protein